jgi:hypothetical protein
MKFIIAAAALAATVIGTQAPAVAQKATVYRYCLQEGGIGRTGTGQILCRYQTLAQCWASRSGPADFCYLNPAYPGRK